MALYSVRYTTNDHHTKFDSFLKSGETIDEVKQLANDHLRYLRSRTSDKLEIKEFVTLS